MTNLPIYLDYAATTPVDPRVAEVMGRYLTHEGGFGNPASLHPFGQAAKQAIQRAATQVADYIAAEPNDIIWTSGATEANNLALKGAAALYQRRGKHIITVKTEHSAVLDCCQWLEKQGYQVTYLIPDTNGLLNLDTLQAAIRPDTILISVMHVNNEIGVIQDIAAIAEITNARGILFHVDAAQSAGKVPIRLNTIPIDLMSFSAHKLYGPKGVGALYIRRKPRIKLAAQIHGGGQQQGMRSGTLPTHQIVGMGEAFALAKTLFLTEYEQIVQLKQRFIQTLRGQCDVIFQGDLQHSVPHIINIRLNHRSAKQFLTAVPELAIAVGSACHARGVEPSHVLRAIGLTTIEAQGAMRFSFGRFTTIDEIDFAVEKLRSQ